MANGNGDMNSTVARQIAGGVTLPIASIIMAGVVAFFTSQIESSSRASKAEAEIAGLEKRMDASERWQERTDMNRFTNRDGAALERRIGFHETIPAHSDVLPRITRIETMNERFERRLDAMEKDHQKFKGSTKP